jgi:uncharacterized protein
MKISVRVIPRASKNKIEKLSEKEYKIWVTSAPIESEANKHVINLIAKYFDVPKSFVRILSGGNSRKKTIEIFGHVKA